LSYKRALSSSARFGCFFDISRQLRARADDAMKGQGKISETAAERKVYIGNLSYRTKWQDLKDHMRQAGECEFCKVLTEDGSDWGWSRGVGIAAFATEEEAQKAIAMLNGSTLMDRQIKVDAWTGSSTAKWQGKGKGKGKSKGYKGYEWGWQEPPYYGKGKDLDKGAGKGKVMVNGDPNLLVYVGNLAYSVKWQDLKDHMKRAGNVEFCKVLTDDGSEWGWSKGVGCVRYSTEEEVDNAIRTLAETELNGRRLLVDHWTSRRSVGVEAATL